MPERLLDFEPELVSLVARVSDAGIVCGAWQLLGTMPGFSREGWPAHTFSWKDDSGRWFVDEFDKDDTTTRIRSTRAARSYAETFPNSILHDEFTLQGHLSIILDAKELLWEEWLARREADANRISPD
ncbi:MAG: hypothetical protein WAR57_05640 [Candidatus Phosphoribacter sp.]|nr:hypothetical protein [Actinomycetales bacterium]